MRKLVLKDYKEIDGIKIFHENVDENHDDYNSKGLDNLYVQEEKHFWFLARKNFILQNFKKYIDRNSKIIEIGSGTGNVSRNLQQNGYAKLSSSFVIAAIQKNEATKAAAKPLKIYGSKRSLKRKTNLEPKSSGIAP